MEDASFITRICKLQRKSLDNPFVSIQVQNDQDEEDISSDREESKESSTAATQTIEQRESLEEHIDLLIKQSLPEKMV